ncbi:Speckle-type POZ protein-like B [Araneus ventricosus]|uniref:Speckle-type POZ protein-like B n=1 Tax=Araneus ventricosus TaxID=182803 RepID=A0A4Y2B0X8_ARAVE|nr:Speckle-type POZ protein-like B [Araneus ventricosus]
MRSEERSLDEKTRCGFWMQELNAEWKVKCLCEQNKQRNPAFIELHRKSLAGEIIISGNLEIYEEKRQCLLKKKFICLLEESCLFTRIDLQYSHNTTKSPSKMFLVTGDISIGARTEASLDLTELVHLTDTDYSSLRQLSNDMEKLLLEKSLLADVSLKCGAVSIPAHKSILSARSPVFEAMFSCPMKEAMENEVVIEGIVEPALRAMLRYMYTGKTEDFTAFLAIYLLFTANKYQIVCLESICSEYLMRIISMENVSFLLLIGDLVSPDLKNFAIDFLCKKCTDYSAFEKRDRLWLYLKDNHSALALETFSAVVKFQEQKLKMRM